MLVLKLSSFLDTNCTTLPAKIPDNTIPSASAGGLSPNLKIIPCLSALLLTLFLLPNLEFLLPKQLLHTCGIFSSFKLHLMKKNPVF